MLNTKCLVLYLHAETKPQSAYAAFVGGFKSKLMHFIHDISDISELPLPLEHTMQ